MNVTVVLIGHRGSGKTQTLNRLASSFYNKADCFDFFDLDQEIEKHYSLSISDIFQIDGELAFRKKEQFIFNKIIKNCTSSTFFVSVGAGFFDEQSSKNLEHWRSKNFCTVWIQRVTDRFPRVFLDRPALNPNVSPVEEYQERFSQRELQYQKIATHVWLLPEASTVDSFRKSWEIFGKFEKWFFEKLIISQNKILGKQSLISLNKGSDPSSIGKYQKSNSNNFSIIKNAVCFDKIFEQAIFSFNTAQLKSTKSLEFLITSKKLLSFGFFEIRDDCVNAHQFLIFQKMIPRSKQILSFRASQSYFIKGDLDEVAECDWPLEKGMPCTELKPYITILSLHQRTKESLMNDLSQLEKAQSQFLKPVHLKVAVCIYSFSELEVLWEWWRKDPDNRSILPRSDDGRWKWFRQVYAGFMKLNFLRDSNRESSVKDQVFLWEWFTSYLAKSSPTNLHKTLSQSKYIKPSKVFFGAVLGDPICHSWSPFFHMASFLKQGRTFVSIPIKTKEISQSVLEFLFKLGLRSAAITSPLKKEFFLKKFHNGILSKKAQDLEAVNTLYFDETNDQITTDNTDVVGLCELLEGKDDLHPIAIWGAGSLSKTILNQLPEAFLFSVRSQKIVNNSQMAIDHVKPQTVIWATNILNKSEYFPPISWKPTKVIDLNYAQNSGGRLYAKNCQAQYFNGEKMFVSQAMEQQKLWNI